MNTITEDTVISGAILSRALSEFTWDSDTKSIWIKGDTGIGKTTWAKKICMKPALFIRHLDQLRYYQPGVHKTIIFDDMSFTHMPRTQQLNLVDRYDLSTIHVRYGIVTLLPATRRIFLSNDDIFDTKDKAISRRLDKHTFLN